MLIEQLMEGNRDSATGRPVTDSEYNEVVKEIKSSEFSLSFWCLSSIVQTIVLTYLCFS